MFSSKILNLDVFATLVAATLVLLLGRFVVQRFAFFKNYTIPEPVAGGILVALLLLVLNKGTGLSINFDLSLQTPFMLAFFATIGLNANLASLRAGGKVLAIFMIAVVGLLFVQNIVGITLAKLLGLEPLMGLIAGSISLSGGHGTSVAWGDTFATKYGFSQAKDIAMACATFGLVLGGLIGGPVARLLLRKLTALPNAEEQTVLSAFEKPKKPRMITSRDLIDTIALIAICLVGGMYLSAMFQHTRLELPTFVWVLFIGVILSNILSLTGIYKVFSRAVSILGNVSLSLFLAMALMSLKLWELAALALPILIILGAQALMMITYSVFVTFRLMGKNYDAAVLAAGHCGFGLGATPTAVANMQAVTDRFGSSHVAFLVVPMVGAFFIDIVNAMTIKLFLETPIFT